MDAKIDPTLTRRRERRPDLQSSSSDIPEDLRQLIRDVAHTLQSHAKGDALPKSAAAEKVISATEKALQELLQPSLTPAQQLHAISKITVAIKDVPKAQLPPMLIAASGELYAWGRTLALEAVVPMLLDCRIRYLHRSLMTLLRTVLPAADAAAEAVVRELYVTRVLRRANALSSFRTSMASPAAAAARYFPAAMHDVSLATVDASRDAVLNFLNSVDGLTSTLMPMMPSVFKDTFLEALPLLAECFQWVVVNATSHSRSQAGDASHSGGTAETETTGTAAGEGARDGNVKNTMEDESNEEEEEASGDMQGADNAPSQLLTGSVRGTVFGEDLEHVRFCVRVVATYVHKYMFTLTAAMMSGAVGVDVSRQFARLLQPTVVMLTSLIFPKDVLNAVGLLVASILTVRTCDAWLLSTVCEALRNDVTRSAALVVSSAAVEGPQLPPAGAAAPDKEASAMPLSDLFRCADEVLAVVCAAEPRTVAQARNGTGAKALHDLFHALTPNGCFALLKGILAHVSSPIRGDWMSLGVLLSPQNDGASTVVAYDVILPAAQQFCNLVQEPETRFLAIQTVDSVVRHVGAVVSTAAAALRKARNEAEKHSAASSSEAAKAAEKAAALTDGERRHLASLCVSTPKLQATLAFSTQLIMALWDDGTQQMSGALYGTYNEILKISETLHRCREQRLVEDATAVEAMESAGAEADIAATLEQVLDVQAERRGKYHALLGHLSMMPLMRFIEVLQRHYHCGDSVCDAVATFSRTLLSGASNHKIGNVAGVVFAQLARAIKADLSDAALPSNTRHTAQEDTTAAAVLRQGIVEPLARAVTEKGYVGVSSNVSEAVNISHITAHFVGPLVKQDPALLQVILSAVAEAGAKGVAAAGCFSPASAETSAANLCASYSCERVEQGVVEVLVRARGVGIDIAPFIAPGSAVLSVLEAATHSLNYEVRNSALCLCVLGTKKVQAVQPWQLRKVEEYLILNMHLGGDSTARKELLEMLKKWVRRLVESYTSKGANAGASEATKAAKKQRREEPVPSAPAGALELGTPTYRRAVMKHCVHLADIFAQNIGLSPRASRAGLAVERRVTAVMGYTVLVQGLRSVLKDEDPHMWVAAPADDEGEQRGCLLHVCVVPALLTTLSDGWSQARDSALELLHLFCDVAPAAVFAEAAKAGCGSGDGAVCAKGGDGASASCAALVERTHQDLLKAQTYRNAEGAVQRFVLFSTRSPEAQANAQRHPQQELRRLDALLEAERLSVVGKCAEMSAMRGSSSYAYIQANPLHGSLSLCAELLSCASFAERQLSLSASPEAVVAGGAVVTQACTQLLQCCCVVLRTCSSLVGTETVTAGATAGLGEHEVVDCRGHIYDRSHPEAESVMRGVVNNTWLSMRVATTAVGRVLKVRAVHLLPYDVVRAAAFELVHALLLTKHNGVMRCVREALKALTTTLVRSRAPQFYQLPAELLDYLFGLEGVTSGDVARMLRRSQGLPHAILAVLEAEDTAVPYCLFPRAMRQLTRVARGDFPLPDDAVRHSCSLGSSTDDVRRSQRSNALNVLKFLFEDKAFADRVVAFIEEAFLLATEGFHDASWYIRNSSLMLFSAVIHRFVGEHPSTGGSGVNTSLHDVARRTPRGVAYAHAELTRGNELVCGVAADPATSAASPEVNVALFPVLQFLSMLSPDPPHLITKASHSEWDDTARMSEAVLRCADSPSLMVRSASAMALCCLVPIASLTRVIARAKHGLALLPYEAPPSTFGSEDLGRDGEQQQQKVYEQASGKSCGSGLNACHGALLQLLQFHAQYVGTMRRHYKQKRSSYATPAVAAAVSHAVCEALLSCQAVLVRACTVCPTVAAALFALLADLVYHGPLQHLSDSQQQALRGFCVAAVESYVLSSQGVLERGSVMDGASAVVVFMAAQHRTAVGAWSAAEQIRLAAVLRHEAAALTIRRGEHNLVSWITAQLLQYSDDAAAALGKDDVAAVLEVLAQEGHCDITALVLSTLMDFFAAGAAMTRIGCIAWGQLVTHLRFAATSLTFFPTTVTAPPQSAAASDPADKAAVRVTVDATHSSATQALYDAIVRLLTPADGNDALWRNSDFCSAALDFISCHDMHAATAAATTTANHTITPGVARILAYYAAPEQPLESRLAVVKALRTAQPFMRRSVAAVTGAGTSSPCPESAVTLLVVLLRLLVDDTSNIREAASAICSHYMWGPQEAPRDQVSCLLVVVRLLRRLHTTGGLPQGTEAARALLAIAGVSPKGDAAHEGKTEANSEKDSTEDEEEGEDNVAGENDTGEGEDVLFQKEAANMFAEETVLRCLVGHIFGKDVSDDVAEACRSFSVLDDLLK